ncbi:hypothetical protein [Nocardia sp. NPDC005998]
MMSPVTPLRCLIADVSPAFLTGARDLPEQQGAWSWQLDRIGSHP